MKIFSFIILLLLANNVSGSTLSLEKGILFSFPKISGEFKKDADFKVKQLSSSRLLVRGVSQRVRENDPNSPWEVDSYLLNTQGELLRTFKTKSYSSIQNDSKKILISSKKSLLFYSMDGNLLSNIENGNNHCQQNSTLLKNGFTVSFLEQDNGSVLDSTINVISPAFKIVASVELNNQYERISRDRYNTDCKATAKAVLLDDNSFAVYIEGNQNSSYIYKISFSGKIILKHKLDGRSPYRREVISLLAIGENITISFSNQVEDPSVFSPYKSIIRTIYPNGKYEDVVLKTRRGESNDFSDITKLSSNGLIASSSSVGDPELFFLSSKGKLIKKRNSWSYLDDIYENAQHNIIVESNDDIEVFNHSGRSLGKLEHESVIGKNHLFYRSIVPLNNGTLLYCNASWSSDNTFDYHLVNDNTLKIIAKSDRLALDGVNSMHICKKIWTPLDSKFLTLETIDNEHQLMLVDFIY